ncbi:hypothetical protein NEOLI_003193 [Neolecta irregularis DAH-3]|uniref:Uncharacterized protein n=1 Tax=Neolecta irregularis (strain DAH-3) TaxID=1198029 RepID=A0A1U7LUT5_NEOID|nr:hypothetical protein NEOLI_003193 [Neolecta irregularis DAH-3]|eukprot:OLL26389.1 hypothetical protein NEOLI_003193 [Neolecta irregularis DAH-3]
MVILNPYRRRNYVSILTFRQVFNNFPLAGMLFHPALWGFVELVLAGPADMRSNGTSGGPTEMPFRNKRQEIRNSLISSRNSIAPTSCDNTTSLNPSPNVVSLAKNPSSASFPFDFCLLDDVSATDTSSSAPTRSSQISEFEPESDTVPIWRTNNENLQTQSVSVEDTDLHMDMSPQIYATAGQDLNQQLDSTTPISSNESNTAAPVFHLPMTIIKINEIPSYDHTPISNPRTNAAQASLSRPLSGPSVVAGENTMPIGKANAENASIGPVLPGGLDSSSDASSQIGPTTQDNPINGQGTDTKTNDSLSGMQTVSPVNNTKTLPSSIGPFESPTIENNSRESCPTSTTNTRFSLDRTCRETAALTSPKVPERVLASPEIENAQDRDALSNLAASFQSSVSTDFPSKTPILSKKAIAVSVSLVLACFGALSGLVLFISIRRPSPLDLENNSRFTIRSFIDRGSVNSSKYTGSSLAMTRTSVVQSQPDMRSWAIPALPSNPAHVGSYKKQQSSAYPEILETG